MLMHHCDRCNLAKPPKPGARQDGILPTLPALPEGWQTAVVRDRANSSDLSARRQVTICVDCDRSLNAWFNRERIDEDYPSDSKVTT